MGKVHVVSTLALALLAACSSGGGSSTPLAPTPGTPAPAAPPPSSPAANAPLATMQLAGAPGFVNAAQRTVYVFDADLATPNHSTCNAGCSGAWPSVFPPAGVALSAPFSMFVRSDGTMQLAYAGRPLYTFVGDSKPGDTNGNNLNEFGGIWHVARPRSGTPAPEATPTPAPMSGGSGGLGY